MTFMNDLLFEIILENNVNNRKCAAKLLLFSENKFLDRILQYLMTYVSVDIFFFVLGSL